MRTVVYCVEDDTNIRELVVYALKTAGFEAQGYSCASDFYIGAEKKLPDLILLDIMLPDEDGMDMLKKLKRRNDTSHIPVIFLTAKTAEYDKVVGLDAGADDYISKPFGVMELISRVKAVLRRSSMEKKQEELILHDLCVNEGKREVFIKGKQVILTCKEFELLVYLMKNRGIVLSRDRILETIWNYEYEGESRTVDVHIGSLRQKLGCCGELIKTIRGIGYKIGD